MPRNPNDPERWSQRHREDRWLAEHRDEPITNQSRFFDGEMISLGIWLAIMLMAFIGAVSS